MRTERIDMADLPRPEEGRASHRGLEKDMKIFIVQEGCKYEGTGIVSLHLTEKDALKKAQDIIATSNYRNYRKSELDGLFKVIHRWNDESDILIIEERETE